MPFSMVTCTYLAPSYILRPLKINLRILHAHFQVPHCSIYTWMSPLTQLCPSYNFMLFPYTVPFPSIINEKILTDFHNYVDLQASHLHKTQLFLWFKYGRFIRDIKISKQSVRAVVLELRTWGPRQSCASN